MAAADADDYDEENMCNFCGDLPIAVVCSAPACARKRLCENCSGIWHGHPDRKNHRVTPVAAAAPSGQQQQQQRQERQQPRTSVWSCPHCTFENVSEQPWQPGDRLVCTVCCKTTIGGSELALCSTGVGATAAAERLNGHSPPRAAAAATPEGASCPVCTFLNSPKAKHCQVCGSDMPVVSPKKSPKKVTPEQRTSGTKRQVVAATEIAKESRELVDQEEADRLLAKALAEEESEDDSEEGAVRQQMHKEEVRSRVEDGMKRPRHDAGAIVADVQGENARIDRASRRRENVPAAESASSGQVDARLSVSAGHQLVAVESQLTEKELQVQRAELLAVEEAEKRRRTQEMLRETERQKLEMQARLVEEQRQRRKTERRLEQEAREKELMNALTLEQERVETERKRREREARDKEERLRLEREKKKQLRRLREEDERLKRKREEDERWEKQERLRLEREDEERMRLEEEARTEGERRRHDREVTAEQERQRLQRQRLEAQSETMARRTDEAQRKLKKQIQPLMDDQQAGQRSDHLETADVAEKLLNGVHGRSKTVDQSRQPVYERERRADNLRGGLAGNNRTHLDDAYSSQYSSGQLRGSNLSESYLHHKPSSSQLVQKPYQQAESNYLTGDDNDDAWTSDDSQESAAAAQSIAKSNRVCGRATARKRGSVSGSANQTVYQCVHCGKTKPRSNLQTTRFTCFYCNKFTCIGCNRPWENAHTGISCKEYAETFLKRPASAQPPLVQPGRAVKGLPGGASGRQPSSARPLMTCGRCRCTVDILRNSSASILCRNCGNILHAPPLD